MQSIGYIGLGVMGLAMTKNLLKAGYPVCVWNRSPEKIKQAVAAGAKAMQSPAALRTETDVVLICVTDEQAVREVLFGADNGLVNAPHGASVVVNMSTIAPSAERSIGETLKTYGISYLDAPVTGGDVGAQNGTLTIMAGGEEQVFHEVLPVFECLGETLAHMGPQGTGQLLKCVNQILVSINAVAMTEALAFLERTPLDVNKALDLISKGAAGSWALSNYGPRVLKGDFKPGFRAQDMLKDIKIVLNEAELMKLQIPGMELVKEFFETLCAKQVESVGIHGLIKLYE